MDPKSALVSELTSSRPPHRAYVRIGQLYFPESPANVLKMVR